MRSLIVVAMLVMCVPDWMLTWENCDENCLETQSREMSCYVLKRSCYENNRILKTAQRGSSREWCRDALSLLTHLGTFPSGIVIW